MAQKLYKVVFSNNFNERTHYVFFHENKQRTYVPKEEAIETAKRLKEEGIFHDIEIVPQHGC